jgi:hypothetical protein
MKMDKMRAAQIKKSAAAMQPHLESIVASLKAENVNFAVGIVRDIGGINLELRTMVEEAQKQQGKMSFFQAVQARRIMQSVNPFSLTPLTSTKGATPIRRSRTPAREASSLR